MPLGVFGEYDKILLAEFSKSQKVNGKFSFQTNYSRIKIIFLYNYSYRPKLSLSGSACASADEARGRWRCWGWEA
jgi:hypothetical protein